jgi:hypothetical protein
MLHEQLDRDADDQKMSSGNRLPPPPRLVNEDINKSGAGREGQTGR